MKINYSVVKRTTSGVCGRNYYNTRLTIDLLVGGIHTQYCESSWTYDRNIYNLLYDNIQDTTSLDEKIKDILMKGVEKLVEKENYKRLQKEYNKAEVRATKTKGFFKRMFHTGGTVETIELFIDEDSDEG